jgi:uncharacterized protein (DUF433 family)
MNDFDRITLDPGIMGGKPCVRGLRVTVGMIAGQVSAGRGIDNILADYPYLERDAITQALRHAALPAQERAGRTDQVGVIRVTSGK